MAKKASVSKTTATKTVAKKTPATKGRWVKKEKSPEEVAELEAKALAFDSVKSPLATAFTVAKKAIVSLREDKTKGLVKFLYNELKELCDVRNKAEGVEFKTLSGMLMAHKYRHHMATLLMEVADDALFTVENNGELSELKERIANRVKGAVASYGNPAYSEPVEEEEHADIGF
tara:strand:- start:170 stop:691 length:522 start_codon:yes stop_codon:yes gene_type:complete